MNSPTRTALRPSDSETELEVDKDGIKEGDRTSEAEKDSTENPIGKDPGERHPWPKPKVHKDDDREDDRTQEAQPDPTPDPIGKGPGERRS